MSSASAQSANVQSAIAFLRDPSVADSPFAKKVAFLESKGLSQLDIDTAVRLAASHDTATPATTSFSSSVSQQQQQQQHQYNPSWRQQQQQQPARYPGAGGAGPNDWRTARPDWRDWFIMAVVTGSVGTVAYSLARKYLFPALQPPSATALAEAQAALEAKYDEASGILASLQDETSAIRETLQSQEESVRESTRAVDSAVKKLGEREEERDRQIGEIKTEMDAIKGLMERMFEKHKDAQSTSLSAIQDEVKSLKSLLARRAEAASASAPAPAATSATASGASGAPAPSSSSASASGSGTNPTAAPFVSSSSPSQSAPQVGAPTPYTGYTSPYAAGGRFGLAGGASASASTSVPGAGSPYASGRQSPNFAAIANRPPGIPAWQQQQQQAAQARAAVPAPMPVAASAEDGDAVKGGPSATVQESTSPEATSVQEQGSGADLAESGEIVDSSEITA